MATLLIVDDDHAARVALCALLSRKGHRVTGVPSGWAAQASFFDRVPDLVILDLCMPGMDGCGLLKVIRTDMRLHALPVILLTGFPDSPALARARDLKVNAILVKGDATLEDIHRTVEAELARALGRSPGRLPAPTSFSGAV